MGRPQEPEAGGALFAKHPRDTEIAAFGPIWSR